MRERFAGWRDVSVTSDGTNEKLAQYTTEFQAREAGRVNAVRLGADLEIHQAAGPTTYQRFDDRTGNLLAPALDPDSRS